MTRSMVGAWLIVHSVGIVLCNARHVLGNTIEKTDLGDLVFLIPTGRRPLGQPAIQNVDISTDGNLGLVTSKARTQIWFLRPRKVYWQMSGDLTPAGMSQDGKWAFATVRRGTRLFDIAGREGCLLFNVSDPSKGRFIPVVPTHAAFDPKSRQFAMIDAANGRTQLSLWNVETGVPRNIDFKLRLSRVHSIAFSSSGDYLHLNGTRTDSPLVQGFLTYRGVPDALIPRIESVIRNGGFAHSWSKHPTAAIVGMADDQSGPSFVSVDRNQILKIRSVNRTSPGYSDAPRTVGVAKEPEATSASFVTIGKVPGPGERKKVAVGYARGSIAIWNWKTSLRTDGIRPHRSRPTTLALSVSTTMQERLLIGYQDGSVLFLRNPTPLKSGAARANAYRHIQKMLRAAGRQVAKVRFPTMAADVTGDLFGFDWLNWFAWLKKIHPYSAPTQDFLETANSHLYRANALVFRRLLDEPAKLFDPTELIVGLDAENLGHPPQNGLEFDLQMVKFEQHQLSIIMELILPKSAAQRSRILTEINDSLFYDGGAVGSARWLGGRIFKFETEAVRRAYVALGNRSPDFRNEKDRRMIGFAVAFMVHGRTAKEFQQYVKRVGGGGGGGGGGGW